MPIDRVSTSKSCVVCIGMEFLFFSQHLKVCRIWSPPVYLKRWYACIKATEKSQLSDSCSFTNLLYKSLKCREGALFERINSILERRRSVGNIYFWKVWTIYWLNVEYIWISMLLLLHNVFENTYLHILSPVYTVLFMK